MEKVKHKIEDILNFHRVAIEYVTRNEKDSKLTYALKKMVGDPSSRNKGILFPIISDYQSKLNDLYIDYASVDEKTKVLLKDAKGNLEYTKENQKELNSKVKELVQTEYEFEPYYATEVNLESLDEFEIGAFKDFVIK